jgi:hypothetical protein
MFLNVSLSCSKGGPAPSIVVIAWPLVWVFGGAVPCKMAYLFTPKARPLLPEFSLFLRG